MMNIANSSENRYSKRPYPNGWTLSALFMARKAVRIMKDDAMPSARLLIPSSCMADELTDRPTVSFPTHSAMLMMTPTREYLIIALFRSLGSMSDMIPQRIAF